jgi:DNA-binding transcriptional MocR family regulator
MWMPRLDFSSDGPLFRLIVQALAGDIASGRLHAGDRLPPHRALADALGVARGTLAHAYAHAERHGLLESHVGRGTFVAGTETPARPYGTLLDPPVVAQDHEGVAPLEGIDPDPASALRELATRPDRMALMRYHAQLGLTRHRRAGIEWVRRLGVRASLDQVLLCSGAQHALFVILVRLLRPGDALLVEEWSYPGLHGLAATLGLRLVAVDVDAEGLNPSALERASRQHRATAVYCMPTAHNPLGIVQSDARRRALAELARRRGLILIEDAANQLLVPDCPAPLACLAPERTYFVASTSKILGPGLRVAFVVAPAAEVPKLAEHVWATQWMVSPFGPEIVSIWLERGVVDATLQAKLREGRLRQATAKRALAGFTVGGTASVFHVWVELPDGCTTQAALERSGAVRQQISLTPSSAFWMRKSRAPEGFRVSLGGVPRRRDLAKLLKALAASLQERAA